MLSITLSNSLINNFGIDKLNPCLRNNKKTWDKPGFELKADLSHR